jgi:hypothetical protein
MIGSQMGLPDASGSKVWVSLSALESIDRKDRGEIRRERKFKLARSLAADHGRT